MRNVLLVVGALLPVCSSISYIAGILRGEVQPERMTRFLLAVITALSLAALVAQGDTSGVWLGLTSFLQSATIGVLSIWYGMGGKSKLDMVCLGLCGVGLVLWLVSGESLFGLVVSVVADLVACVPSLVKTYALPHTEQALAYVLDALAGACILAAGPYGWQALLLPGYLLLINAVYVAFITQPRWRRRYRRADLLGDTV